MLLNWSDKETTTVAVVVFVVVEFERDIREARVRERGSTERVVGRDTERLRLMLNSKGERSTEREENERKRERTEDGRERERRDWRDGVRQ